MAIHIIALRNANAYHLCRWHDQLFKVLSREQYSFKYNHRKEGKEKKKKAQLDF